MKSAAILKTGEKRSFILWRRVIALLGDGGVEGFTGTHRLQLDCKECGWALCLTVGPFWIQLWTELLGDFVVLSPDTLVLLHHKAWLRTYSQYPCHKSIILLFYKVFSMNHTQMHFKRETNFFIYSKCFASIRSHHEKKWKTKQKVKCALVRTCRAPSYQWT